MVGNEDGCLSSDEVIAKLIEMGFEDSVVINAVKLVGPSFDAAVECILNGSCRNQGSNTSSSSRCSVSKNKVLSKRTMQSSCSDGQLRQSSILDHFRKPKICKTAVVAPNLLVSGMDVVNVSGQKENSNTAARILRGCHVDDVGVDANWELRANSLLQKHFGYSSLKGFQKEALAAWLAHRDCLVLAATGSGKSLCFQLPALLTRKVVVVISPLISLMHDQCLKLSKHGISACFLGSGQPDSSVEQKAMRGMYDIIYVCPETILRLIKPLQKLAKCRGIALFAIDEVHCVSKWGHDFRHDYRRLSVLRENFSVCNLEFLKFDIPLMALTATATVRVREDVLESLNMSKETKIVLTSFFRPNLQFLVKHSRTSSSSYEEDFRQLIDKYVRKRKNNEAQRSMISEETHDISKNSVDSSMSKADRISSIDVDSDDDDCSDKDDDDMNLTKEDGLATRAGKEMSIEYLENDVDVFQRADDLDVAYGEFYGQSPSKDRDLHGSFETDLPKNQEERLNLLQKPLEDGPTIIYVPTRKETLSIAKYLCSFGVKAAAYNASLPKSHLRRVHTEFHENTVEVVVATIAFGMGIDKLNVRRIIHYGWPQSLEAYYQEAGRAGRDGKLAECILYANLSRPPSLLPSKRSEDQTKQAYKMLSDCFRYGMNTTRCRAKTLVEYFREDFNYEKCLLCDICVYGPPKMENLKEEADVLMQVIAAYHEQRSFHDCSYEDSCCDHKLIQKPNLKTFVGKIMEQFQKFSARGHLWWRGLARIMDVKGYIRESDDKIHVQIKFPEPTRLGLDFLQFEREEPFYCYPEADMLLSMDRDKSYSTFTYCGKGWADPKIRHERLERMRLNRKPRKLRQRKREFLLREVKPDMKTARVRRSARLQKQK